MSQIALPVASPPFEYCDDLISFLSDLEPYIQGSNIRLRNLSKLHSRPLAEITAIFQSSCGYLYEYKVKKLNRLTQSLHSCLKKLDELPVNEEAKKFTKAANSYLASIQRVFDLYAYVDKHKNMWVNRAQRDGMSVYILPKESNLDRAIHFTADGDVFVHLNRKKCGDELIGKGIYKIVTWAVNLKYLGASYASAGFRYKGYRLPREIEALKYFKGEPWLVKMVDFFRYQNKEGKYKWRAIFKYYNSGNLLTAIREKSLSGEDKKTVFIQLIQGLGRIHELNCLHRDFKAENIFLHRDRKKDLKTIIGDLGSACKMEDELGKRDHFTTSCIVSPEYLTAHLRNYGPARARETNTQLDSWGLGCTLYELLRPEEIPWNSASDEENFATLLKVKGDWFIEPKEKNSPFHLVWELLQKRITATQALERLKEIDWTLLGKEEVPENGFIHLATSEDKSSSPGSDTADTSPSTPQREQRGPKEERSSSDSDTPRQVCPLQSGDE